ncbi:hypothetical protein NC653_001830 [Populus alba x Populus x berolinensis]|uniref:Uncharacterized protein n=2 Tax=Populus TaxID=3689 RepID=A0A4U5P7N4_POPAL|nr:hypothetical protein NC653_001830 [Populus alba x Populus x berolinensis]TKR91951.1 hypothetical protein D5086_0000218890 [Populus alba]
MAGRYTKGFQPVRYREKTNTFPTSRTPKYMGELGSRTQLRRLCLPSRWAGTSRSVLEFSVWRQVSQVLLLLIWPCADSGASSYSLRLLLNNNQKKWLGENKKRSPTLIGIALQANRAESVTLCFY